MNYTRTGTKYNSMEITPTEKAEDLFNSFKIILLEAATHDVKVCDLLANRFALKCCAEVLGYMGSDRGHAFWSEVEQELLKFYK